MSRATGLQMWVIRNGQQIIDLRLAFYVEHGNDNACYLFDMHSNKADQARANAALVASSYDYTSDDKVRVVGKKARHPHHFNAPYDGAGNVMSVKDLAKANGSETRIRVGKRHRHEYVGNPPHFTVHVTMDLPTSASSANQTVGIEVPFNGDCGALLNHGVFQGKTYKVAEGWIEQTQLEATLGVEVVDSKRADAYARRNP